MNIEYNSNGENKIEFTVPDEYNGADAKSFLRRYCKVSARTLSKLKRTNLGITRNNALLKTTDILKAGDVVVLSLPDDVNEIVPTKGGLDILFEDDYVMVVNKDNKVEQKYITLGSVIGDKQVVKTGLKGDERVIVQGLQKVAQGMTVNPNHLAAEE